jgi:hypothetical protein
VDSSAPDEILDTLDAARRAVIDDLEHLRFWPEPNPLEIMRLAAATAEFEAATAEVLERLTAHLGTAVQMRRARALKSFFQWTREYLDEVCNVDLRA